MGTIPIPRHRIALMSIHTMKVGHFLTLPLVGVPEGFLATLSINIFVNIGLIEII